VEEGWGRKGESGKGAEGKERMGSARRGRVGRRRKCEDRVRGEETLRSRRRWFWTFAVTNTTAMVATALSRLVFGRIEATIPITTCG